MTYWWESTRDVIAVCREVFPKAVIRVGGIYPTLAPEHAMANLGLRDPLHLQGRELDPLNPEQQRRDIIVSATIPDANPLPLDLELYEEDGVGEPRTGAEAARLHDPDHEPRLPVQVRLLRGERAQRGAKGLGPRVRQRLRGVKHAFAQGIREFCFYEDNLLLGKDNFSTDPAYRRRPGPEGNRAACPGRDRGAAASPACRQAHAAGGLQEALPAAGNGQRQHAEEVGPHPHEHGQVLLRPGERGRGWLQAALPGHQLLHALRPAR